MGLNETPSGERVHIGFFGRRNAGKSSLVNAVTGQELAVVSDTRGTTTDPVSKAMELLPIGPVVIIDTPGFDDEGALGELRIRKTRQILNKSDVAVLVADCTEGLKDCDRELIEIFRQKEIPWLLVWNKCDLKPEHPEAKENEIYVSATEKIEIEALKEKIATIGKTEENKLMLVGDLMHPGDMAVLVIPIDKAAPKGRLILPQQQVIRDILEAEGAAVCVKEYELRETLEKFKEPPAIVITDSQVFAKVSADVPESIPLTSFSILMARFKGKLQDLVAGVNAIKNLKPGSKVLISEGCTHRRQCDDIGTVKIPNLLKKQGHTDLQLEFTSGGAFPKDVSQYDLIIHCGACMLTRREVLRRIECAVVQGTPIVNYGVLIAALHGILERAISPFVDELEG